MRGSIVIFGLFLVATTYASKVPIGRVITLTPNGGVGRQETLWELVTNRGSKMTLTCLFRTYSCSVATIKVFDGERFEQFCPEDGQVFRLHSVREKMSVTIVTSGSGQVAFCQVQATKGYIDVPEPTIDSSEHGKSEKAKCGRRNHPVGRIVNGKEAGINEFPFAVLIILADNGFPFCGGSIITEHHVLTAAHCTDPLQDRQLAVVVGEHDIRTMKETPHTKILMVSKIYQHVLYSPDSNMADIAILETAKAIEFSNFVGPVCLPTSAKNLVDQHIKVMGWGLTRDKSEGGRASPQLRHVNLRVIDPEVCKVLYGIDTLQLTQICTYNNDKDSCQGDSGGPLVHADDGRYVQVALVSYGRKCASTDSAVNTDVAHFMPWIKRQLAMSSKKVNIHHM